MPPPPGAAAIDDSLAGLRTGLSGSLVMDMAGEALEAKAGGGGAKGPERLP